MDDFLNLEEEDFDWGDENELISRYENMLKNHQSVFFSVDDYEQLYFYYTNFYLDFCLLQNEQLKKGGAVIKAALAQYPDAEILQLLQTYHLYRENRISKMTLVAKLENLQFPDYEQEHFTHVLAHIYRRIGERKKAFSLFTDLLQNADFQDDKEILYYEIMFLYETADNAPQAVECCNNILKMGNASQKMLFGDMYEYYFLKPIAIPVFELLTQQYAFSMYAWLYLGKSYADIMMYDEAIQSLRYAVAMSNQPLPLIGLGRVLAISGNISEAFDCFQEAIELDPTQMELFYTEMGDFLYNLKDAEHSMYFFLLALDANKNDIDALIGMALSLSFLERYDDSVAYIMRARKIKELSLGALLLLADNYIELDRDDEALDIFQHLAKQHPKVVDVWLFYSNYYAIIEDFEQACVIAKQGLAILHDDPQLLYRIANYCFLGGDISLGIIYLQLAIQADVGGISDFIDYDEEVVNIPEVAEIINLLNN